MPATTKRQRAIWGVSTVAAMLVAGTALAQDDADEVDEVDEESVDEVVVVTGIRGSMQQSLERKRNADHFVDAITAEDIGAFPDQNLAESLQRVSGVAIDRKSGELHITDRDRLNVSSSVQFRPSERVDLTLDVLYTDNAEDERDYWRDFRIQQGHGNITDATLANDNGTGVFTMISTSGAGLFVQHATEVVDTEALNFGANLEIQATDRLVLSFDATISQTESPITEFGGNDPFPAEADFMSGLGNTFPGPILNPNLDVIQQTFTTRPDEILAGRGFNTGTAKSLEAFRTGRFNEDLNHDDDGNAIYAMVTFAGNLGDLPYSGNFGVRYVDNNTGSIGEISQPVDIIFHDGQDPEIILSDPEFVNVSHSYTHVLPSFNMRFDPREDVVVCASLAKVLSRPRYLDLNPRQSVQARVRTMRGGNGELDPTTAVQFDLALEWYFADYSIASLGIFTKAIESFVQPEIEEVPWAGGTDPATGLPLVFTLFRPLNTGESDLRGFELNFQRTMEGLLPSPLDGLGVIANYTFISSGSDFRNQKTNAAYGIPGLSENTINLTLFYEKGPWGARVA